MTEQNLEIKIMCLYQFIRPKQSILKNNGDCYSCKTDEKNKYCKSYYPINVRLYDVNNE